MWFLAPNEETEAEDRWPEQPEGERLYGLLGSRWAVAVLHELGGGALRYNMLHRRLGGVSHKMLTQTLRRLRRAALVERRAMAGTPLNVDYRLTSSGIELLAYLAQLEVWALAHGLPW